MCIKKDPNKIIKKYSTLIDKDYILEISDEESHLSISKKSTFRKDIIKPPKEKQISCNQFNFKFREENFKRISINDEINPSNSYFKGNTLDKHRRSIFNISEIGRENSIEPVQESSFTINSIYPNQSHLFFQKEAKMPSKHVSKNSKGKSIIKGRRFSNCIYFKSEIMNSIKKKYLLNKKSLVPKSKSLRKKSFNKSTIENEEIIAHRKINDVLYSTGNPSLQPSVKSSFRSNNFIGKSSDKQVLNSPKYKKKSGKKLNPNEILNYIN